MNKFVKRGCTVLLALTLALGMSVSAFAAGEPTVKKDYKLANAGTTSPEETFTFEVKAKSMTEAFDEDGNVLDVNDMPALTIDPAHYAGGEAGSANEVQNLTISHMDPFPNVGVYTYTVKETKGNTAGVTYYEKTMKLVVTVAHGDGDALDETYAFYPDASNATTATKGAAIENTYSAGSLTVTKEVKGGFGDKNQDFNFEVEFVAPEGQKVNSTITVQGDNAVGYDITPDNWVTAETDGLSKTTASFSLKAGQSVTLDNVPYGVTYTVTEDNYTDQGYDATYDEKQSGTIKAATVSTTVINNKPATVDTGVILHSAPYVLLLVGVGAAAVAFLILRKHREV